MIGFSQFDQQPLHFILFERHIHLDGGVTRDRGCDAGTNLLQIQRLLLAGELVKQFVQHVLDRAGIHARWRNFDRQTASTKGFSFESVVLQLVGNFGKRGLLRRGQLQYDRHQQPLAPYFLCRPFLEHAFKQDTLVRDVLIDNP